MLSSAPWSKKGAAMHWFLGTLDWNILAACRRHCSYKACLCVLCVKSSSRELNLSTLDEESCWWTSLCCRIGLLLLSDTYIVWNEEVEHWATCMYDFTVLLVCMCKLWPIVAHPWPMMTVPNRITVLKKQRCILCLHMCVKFLHFFYCCRDKCSYWWLWFPPVLIPPLYRHKGQLHMSACWQQVAWRKRQRLLSMINFCYSFPYVHVDY